jgi:hypothetical protein
MPETDVPKPKRMVVGFMVGGDGRLHGPGVYGPSRLTFGLLVIALGVLFMLDNLGIARAGDILRWWPALLVVYGVARITGWNCRVHLASGVLFTILGSWMLLHTFHLVRLGILDLWPLVLILLGASMVTGTLQRARSSRGGDDASPSLNALALLSGVQRKVVAQDFRGGDITAIMGGHEIDLRPARMAEGQAVLDLFVWWGGVELRVPEDWRVSVEAQPIMGAVVDETRAPIGEARGVLVLRGLVVMGGVEVKN